jgi:hypothetical protein
MHTDSDILHKLHLSPPFIAISLSLRLHLVLPLAHTFGKSELDSRDGVGVDKAPGLPQLDLDSP